MSLSVEQLWRYPVKTLAGERLKTAEIGQRASGDEIVGTLVRRQGPGVLDAAGEDGQVRQTCDAARLLEKRDLLTDRFHQAHLGVRAQYGQWNAREAGAAAEIRDPPWHAAASGGDE